MINIHDVTKLYKNRRGIRNITLDVADGEILGLLGANGSGKTTLMKAMLGLLPIDSGNIMYYGTPLDECIEDVMSYTGALIEAPAIYKTLSAADNLRLCARNPEDIADIDRVLEMVHLEQYKNEKAGRFSLGMKQRLGLAQALMGNPMLLVLDEPVNGLDIEGVVEVREYFRKLNSENNSTIIISSHIASEIEKLCTRAAVLCDGEIIAEDSTEHILSLYPSVEEYYLTKLRERRGV